MNTHEGALTVSRRSGYIIKVASWAWGPIHTRQDTNTTTTVNYVTSPNAADGEEKR